MNEVTVLEAMEYGVQAHKKGDFQKANRYYTAVLTALPDHPDANHNMGVLALIAGNGDLALSYVTKALSADPSREHFYVTKIKILIKLNRLVEAKQLCQIARDCGMSSKELDSLEAAIAEANKSKLKVSGSNDTELHQLNLDRALQRAKKMTKDGELAKARILYSKILKKYPNNKTAKSALSKLLNTDKRKQKNSKDQIKKSSPSSASFNLVKKLYHNGDYSEALQKAYKLYNIEPHSNPLNNLLGAILSKLGRFDEAINHYHKALESGKNYALLHNLATAYKDSGELPEASKYYQKSLELNPHFHEAVAQLSFVKAQMCDWNRTIFEDNYYAMSDKELTQAPSSPFTTLSMEDSPHRHAIRSKAYADLMFGEKTVPPRKIIKRPGDRVRVAYLGADFHNHATMYLMNGVFENHDKEKFEVFVYSYGDDIEDEMRLSVKQNADHFFHVKSMSNQEIAKLIQSHKIDIAIDLKGYTRQQRVSILAHRPAPVQMTFLGYPGGLGCNFIDYLIADQVVIPPGSKQFYSEKIIYLPDCYQPNDRNRAISKSVTHRSDFKLPDEAFVFCCFNRNYKITRLEFDVWMELLVKVPKSVLWLLRSNTWAENNLKQEALDRGIDPNRLIFAGKLPLEQHLERHRHADLFLDTFNYNAHTTASDALWAGLPVVTKIGESFSARVGASLLTAVGMPELITNSIEDYKNLSLKLATNPQTLHKITQKLNKNRFSKPLFDTLTYTRHLEDVFQKIYQECLQDQLA